MVFPLVALVVVVLIVTGTLVHLRRRAGRQRVVSSRRADAELVRELEHKMGIGPFAGREDYCDLTKCTSQNHTHEDVDSETQTGKPVPKKLTKAPRPKRIMFPAFEGDNGIRAGVYEPGQAPHELPFETRAIDLETTTLDQLMKMMEAGLISPSVVKDLVDHTAVPSRINPSHVHWNSLAALERGRGLALEGRIDSYCLGDHDHNEMGTWRGTIRRLCAAY